MEYFLNLVKRSSVTEDDNDVSNSSLRDFLEDVVRAARRRVSFSSNLFGRRVRVSRQQRKDAMYKRYSCTTSSERLSDSRGRLSSTSRRLSDTTRRLAETTRLLNGNMNGSTETVMPLSNSRCHTYLKRRRFSCPLGSPQSGNHTHARRKSYAGLDKEDDHCFALPRQRRSANTSSSSLDSDVFADSTYQTQLPPSRSACSEQNYSSSHSEQLHTTETSVRRLFNSLRDNLLSLRGDSAETVEESVARQLKERKKAMKNLKLTRRQSRDFIRFYPSNTITSAQKLFNSHRDKFLSLRGDSKETVEESVARQLKERKKAMKNLRLIRGQSRDFILLKYNLN